MSKLALEIRHLTPADLSAMLELDQACFGGLWTMDGYQRELDSPNSDLLGLFSSVCVNRLLGICCFWSILDEAHITILAVDPQVPPSRLRTGFTVLCAKNCLRSRLERATLEVRASNSAAISLYQKFGFKTAGRRPRYYKDNDEDALILWLPDLQQPEFQQTLDNWFTIISDRLTKASWSLVIDP
ncbi:GNAT family N-acetyltransferase [Scytonema sp. PRP1]|uniref:GNAT family N-acetyltransferase n=1 Tax=Scytonema sp. PRP1 TaxID=3120513 RepID=UPI00300CDFB8